MSQTRIYLPLNLAGLDALADQGEIAPPPVAAHAVTDSLVASLSHADEEEREYVALCDAADAAGLLRDQPGHRRVVAAADVESAWVTAPASGASSDTRIEVTQAVPLRRIVSFHVDERGSAQATEDNDLLWYDVTELEEVRRFSRS